jgi:nifR3 family TIM-barrel protein
MVSVDGLLYQNDSSLALLKIHAGEQPIGFQFFGSQENLFKKVIPIIVPLNPALIDINFGCPVRKVVAKGAGAALLHDLKKMEKIVSTVKSGCSLPVTAKIRLGWDQQNIVAKEAALAVAAGGADAITVHARTRNQGYSGKASWEYIAEVKDNLQIPVIGNGDVFDGISALKMFQSTAVDGIMLARGVLGRPWIFQEIISYLQKKEKREEPSVLKRFEILENHYKMEVSEFGEQHALNQMRKHFAWYTHGLPHAAKLRNHIFRAKKFSEIQKIFSGARKTMRPMK